MHLIACKSHQLSTPIRSDFGIENRPKSSILILSIKYQGYFARAQRDTATGVACWEIEREGLVSKKKIESEQVSN